MAQSIVKFLVRRGTDIERKQITLADGELGVTKDANSHRLFVGDGITPGGWPAASKLFVISTITNVDATRFVQMYDLVYFTDMSAMYALTGTDNTTLANYLKLT